MLMEEWVVSLVYKKFEVNVLVRIKELKKEKVATRTGFEPVLPP